MPPESAPPAAPPPVALHPTHLKVLVRVVIALVVLSVVIWGVWYVLSVNSPSAKLERDAQAHQKILESVPVNAANAQLTPGDKASILANFNAQVAAKSAATSTKKKP